MDDVRGSHNSKKQLNFQPFKAWRYNTERVKISAVLAPPYDVISPEKQQKLYENSPFNSIRLILNKKDPADTDQNNAYTRARDTFQEWQKQGVLVQEEEPCFYVYRQTFKDPVTHSTKNRFALLGRVPLDLRVRVAISLGEHLDEGQVRDASLLSAVARRVGNPGCAGTAVSRSGRNRPHMV
jgi:hypothetical protein